MAVIQYVFNALADLYVIVIFIMVIFSWLINFNVINRHNRFVDGIWRACLAITEPALVQIRKVMPNLGGIDLSPIILLIGVNALRYGLNHYVFNPMVSRGL